MAPREINDKSPQPQGGTRPLQGIVRDRIDEVKAIQTLLADVYKDAGDGRTLIRELVQNADDALARRLTFTVLEDGWRDANNSLLHGPALLVANDGPFKATDRDAMHKAIGGAKEADVDKIGTFGIGLKSIFHICEAFLYIGAAQSDWQPNVVNPWYGTVKGLDSDPIRPDWDFVDADDRERLCVAVKHMLGETDSGLLLWVPLRLAEHNRGTRGQRFWLGDSQPEPKHLLSWFADPTPAALLLAQCGRLQSVEARRAANPEAWATDSATLLRVTRQGGDWLGRYRDHDTRFTERRFGGKMESADSKWSVIGVESLGSSDLDGLKSRDDWPQSIKSSSIGFDSVPRKGLAHAAVTVHRPVGNGAKALGMRLRWAAFLPLDDHPNPSPSSIVESCGSSPAWEIILHGYFWPSQDRRSIPGVTDTEGEATDAGTIREIWNRTLSQQLLLPLLPSALAKAVAGVGESTAQEMLAMVRSIVERRGFMPCVVQRHWLLPVVAQNRVQWKAVDARVAEASRILSIPNWGMAPAGVRKRFLASLEDAGDTVFIEHSAPRFSQDVDEWTSDHLERLLNSVQGDAFATTDNLKWITRVVKNALSRNGHRADGCLRTFVRWLVRWIGEGTLGPTVRPSIPRHTRDELRQAWRDMCSVIPTSWVVETPVDTRRAVVELAKCDGVIGEGLFPLPVGRRPDVSGVASATPDHGRIDSALAAIGRQLRDGVQSDKLRASRLLLAENLLSARSNDPMDTALSVLPFLRAIRLPEGQNEAWSIAKLRRTTMGRRVFAAGPTASGREQPGHNPFQARKAVHDLAHALGEPIWTVRGAAARAVGIDVPAPDTEALADAVLTAADFAEPTARERLVRHLARAALSSARARSAVRTLLAARPAAVVGDDTELFKCSVRCDGDERVTQGTMLILLRLLDQKWRAVDASLVDSLSQEMLSCLAVKQVTRDALRRTLDRCLEGQVDWRRLTSSETLLLIAGVPSTSVPDRARWSRMPLHRHVDGDRDGFDERALRLNGGDASSVAVPRKLRSVIRVLDPEPDVAHLYRNVPALDQDGILRLMLREPRPWRFANTILRHVLTDGGTVRPLRDHKLGPLLRERQWLPRRDNGGIAPEAVIIAPKELLSAIGHLATHGALGDKQLPDAVSPQIWSEAEGVVREVLGRMKRTRQVERLAEALDPDRVAAVDDGAWLLVADPARVDQPFLASALETSLVSRHRGWILVHAAAQALVLQGDRSARDLKLKPLLKLARSLCRPIPLKRQAEMLSILADEKPAKDSPAGRLFRTLLAAFADTDGFRHAVLPLLRLPAQDGQWHASQDIAVSETGVARCHLPIPELRSPLRLDDTERLAHILVESGDRESMTWESLMEYFERWRGRISNNAVGAFLSLLGRSLDGVVDIERFAGDWLGTDISIAGLRTKLLGSRSASPWDGMRVAVSRRVQRGDRVLAHNVVGQEREMEATDDNDTIFATDPQRHPERMYGKNPRGAYWEIRLRDVDPEIRSSDELMRLLRGSVEKWAARCLGIDHGRVIDWWREWGKSSQADIRPVLASIKAHLPLTLRQLDVRTHPPLWGALREAERAQRRREQAPSDRSISQEQKSVERLAVLVGEPEHQQFLWLRVNELIRRYGYREDSVLLELAQNADDALAEAAEINAGTLPRAAQRLQVQVDNGREADSRALELAVMHWGRPINDTGGAAFLDGRDRQWDQDLYFMMLMNLSGKPGERPGGGATAATTGRFGLGFKSVHLISSRPRVISGFTAFSIAGGLLPNPEDLPADAEKWRQGGRRATRVELALRGDRAEVDILKSIFKRFCYARVLLPVFARQVREVVVVGGPCPGVHAFDGEPVEGALGWSVGEETDFPQLSRDSWRILRYRPADVLSGSAGTAAVALGLRDGLPTALPSELPFLWNVTPTSEAWDCGYVVNGPFKLDPGRTHVSLDDESTTLEAARRLGEELGNGLIALHDAVLKAGYHACLHADPRSFLSSLWTVLAAGTETRDRLRLAFLRQLHGPGRGVSAWMAARPAVPTNLPAPFPSHLPSLGSRWAWEVAVDGLDSRELCATLNDIDDEDFRSLVRDSHIVSGDVDQILGPLHRLSGEDSGSASRGSVSPRSLFERLVERWDGILTPAQLQALRPLSHAAVAGTVFRDSGDAPLGRSLHADSVTKDIRPLAELLVESSSGTGRDPDDDALLAAFAPEASLLHPEYIGHVGDRRMFLWLRGRHRTAAAEVADWCRNVDEARRPAVLRYLLDGRLCEAVLEHITSWDAGSTSWLGDFDVVSQALGEFGAESWQYVRVLTTLFPDRRLQVDDAGVTVKAAITSTPEPDPAFFNRLAEWWDDAGVRDEVTAAYEERAWPRWLRDSDISGSLKAGSKDHWLALLVLGACRSLGRTRNFQHRGFLDFIHERGWWDVFEDPVNERDWMRILREWHDGESDSLPHQEGMSLFPAIYQLSRYRGVYSRLLRSAGQRPPAQYRIDRLFNPRTDPAVTGGGTNLDAPPAPLAMGRHWILRELVRLGVVEGEHLYADCWVPSDQVVRFLHRFGLEMPSENVSNCDAARAVFDFLAAELGTEAPNLHRAFDVPIRHLVWNAASRRLLGLDE